jgi:hypothetical protein
MKQLPIGISDYKKLVEDKYYYIDKTLFIKEFWNAAGSVVLIPRPRRFGKTLNLSMLRYFFERTASSNTHLFENTAIWQDSECRALYGQYPVVFLTFKDIKALNWEDAYKHFVAIIAAEFERYASVVVPGLSDIQRQRYQVIVEKQANKAEYADALRFLTEVLRNHYKKRAIVLLDEYDTPIHAGYHHGYYEQMVDFMRGLLSAALKDNNNLERGALKRAITFLCWGF